MDRPIDDEQHDRGDDDCYRDTLAHTLSPAPVASNQPQRLPGDGPPDPRRRAGARRHQVLDRVPDSSAGSCPGRQRGSPARGGFTCRRSGCPPP